MDLFWGQFTTSGTTEKQQFLLQIPSTPSLPATWKGFTMQSKMTKQTLKITVRTIELGSNVYMTLSLLFSLPFIDVETHLENLVVKNCMIENFSKLFWYEM
jgi:hypothetical protein